MIVLESLREKWWEISFGYKGAQGNFGVTLIFFFIFVFVSLWLLYKIITAHQINLKVKDINACTFF